MTKLAKALPRANWFRLASIAVILLAGVVAGLETSESLLASHGDQFGAVGPVG